MKTPRFVSPLPLLLAGLLVASIAGCSSAGTDSAPSPTPAAVEARIATAETAEIDTGLPVTGTTEPWARVSPAAKIMARIDEMPVDEGQWVERGQLLARLDQRDLQAVAAQSEAAVRMAEAQLENARSQEARMRRLHERGSATDKNLEDAVAGLRVAEASLAQAQANLQAARVTIDYAELRSPVAGWIVSRMAQVGDTTAPGRPLLTIEDRSRMKVMLQVPEASVPGLERGHAVKVRIDVLALSADGTVDRVLPRPDGSRTFDVQVLLDNPGGRIRTGMFVRAALPLAARTALVVPEAAVIRRGQLEGVFVVGDDGLARTRWLRLGDRVDQGYEVLSGLEPGERYLPAPPPGIVDGTPVRGA